MSGISVSIFPGVGLGDAAGICISGIPICECGAPEGDGTAEGVGDGEAEGVGLLAGIWCPLCCENTLWANEKDKTKAIGSNAVRHFGKRLVIDSPLP
jgi:hypothetical protein